jgi:Sodium/hydrogen exchanger family
MRRESNALPSSQGSLFICQKRNFLHIPASSAGLLRFAFYLLVFLQCTTLGVVAASGSESSNATSSIDQGGSEGEPSEDVEPVVAVLFPWFSLAVGTLAYLALSRFLPWIPYTALMFTIGTIAGICVVRMDRAVLLTESISDFWLNIDSEVLLLVFLPGLIAKDAMQLDATLFRASFWQCIVFAFPMVLAGTVLTALVCYYVFPFGWSFNLSMTIGSVRLYVASSTLTFGQSHIAFAPRSAQILSATDPVAVAALMAEVGAPPRLQIHISGER